MRILSVTAGAAGMYCGSCFRDNALARELLARRHAVMLVPVYTPTRTDETNVSHDEVLFGGISVYLQQHSAFFRHVPRFVDRLLDAPRVIGAFAGRAVSTDAGMLGELTLSMLSGEDGLLRREFEKLVEWTRDQPTPDVINLPNSLLIALGKPLRRAFKRPVFVTLQGEELFLDGLAPEYRARALERISAQVADVDGFIAVSDYCAEFMTQYLRIPRQRIDVVPLGIDMTGYERHAPTGGPFRIGYFARIAPEKGLLGLAEAYVRLRRRTGNAGLRLDAAGYMGAAQAPYLEQVRRLMTDAGFGDEFHYAGELDRDGKLAYLRHLDVLSVPATYDEPKGMFLLEAMAGGVPVVQPRRGAFTEVVEKTGGGLLVTPDDPDAFADALFTLWNDCERTAALGRLAFDGVRAHYTIQQSATRLLQVYETRRAAAPL
jgi:glycosyltransferase involved in cell wall biosynthesis